MKFFHSSTVALPHRPLCSLRSLRLNKSHPHRQGIASWRAILACPVRFRPFLSVAVLGLLMAVLCLLSSGICHATTNNVEYVRIPVVRIPSTVIEEVEVPVLQVEALPLAEQSSRLSRLIAQWGQVYHAVSGESIHPQSYFGRKQAAILKQAAAEGASDEVMEMLVDYQTQLNQYLKRRTLNSRKEP